MTSEQMEVNLEHVIRAENLLIGSRHSAESYAACKMLGKHALAEERAKEFESAIRAALDVLGKIQFSVTTAELLHKE